MTRERVKLAWVIDEKSRSSSLRKRRSGVLQKIRELTILCDVKACLVMFSPNEAKPTIWPSIAEARELLDGFFALPDAKKKKNETTLESFLEEKIKKAREQLKKSQNKNNEYVTGQLMMHLHRGRLTVDLDSTEISELLALSKDKILHCRKKLESMQHPPLGDPPMPMLLEAQSQEPTTVDDVVHKGLSEDDGLGEETAAEKDNIDVAPLE